MLLCDGNHILRGAVALDVAALTTTGQSAASAPNFSPPSCEGPLSTLTPREAEVLRRIAAGQNTKKMAGEMNVTTETLRSYVKKVLAKLGAHSRLEAATLASRHIMQARQELDHDQPLFAALTPREREILAHLMRGSELREVARQLHMSLRTVNTHLQNLRGKLGVHSTLEAVALARARLAQRPEATDPGGPA